MNRWPEIQALYRTNPFEKLNANDCVSILRREAAYRRNTFQSLYCLHQHHRKLSTNQNRSHFQHRNPWNSKRLLCPTELQCHTHKICCLDNYLEILVKLSFHFRHQICHHKLKEKTKWHSNERWMICKRISKNFLFATYGFRISSGNLHIHTSCQCEKPPILHSKVMCIHVGLDLRTTFPLFVHSHRVHHKSDRKEIKNLTTNRNGSNSSCNFVSYFNVVEWACIFHLTFQTKWYKCNFDWRLSIAWHFDQIVTIQIVHVFSILHWWAEFTSRCRKCATASLNALDKWIVNLKASVGVTLIRMEM